jgi:hypothetical protein
MDLSSINVTQSAEIGAEMELEHPITGDALTNDDGKPMLIELYGSDSAVYRNKQREMQSRRMAKMMKGKGNPVLSDAEACELLAAATKGWSGLVEDGKALKFSAKAAFDLYMAQPWIREQVDTFIADRGNFFKG